MTIQDIANHACLVMGLTDATTLDLAKAFCRQRYSLLWDQHNWRQAMTTTSLAVPAGAAEVALPAQFERALGLRWNTRALEAIDHGLALRLMPETFDQVGGETVQFIEMPLDAQACARVRLVPPAAEAGTLYILGKRRCPGLPADTSVPMLSGAATALCALTLGDLWRWQQQFSKANDCYAEAGTHVEKMLETERTQAATVQRLVPEDGFGSGHRFVDCDTTLF